MIKEIITFSDIIIYWDVFDKKSKNERYYVYLNGELKGTTDKTHTTLRGITEKTAEVEIFTDDSKKELFYQNTFVMKEKTRFIDVTSEPYNAVGDGKAINTSALQKAIDDCKENECVYIPQGVYLTGALTLHSNMELYIDENAVLQGSSNPEDYLPKIWSRYEGVEMECFSSLLNIGNIENRDAIACENVVIHGGGKIFGGGRDLAENVILVESERMKDEFAGLEDDRWINPRALAGRSRPKLINISCAKNVFIENVAMGNAACWNVHMIYSDNIVTCNCSIYSHEIGNGDGWDPDSSTNCTLFNCAFDTGDDCVAIKSGKNPEGNIIGKPCTNIRVFDCSSKCGHGLSFGSEMSGGISDVYVWDCNIRRSQIGCNIKATKKRGGYIKNIYFHNCSFGCINISTVPYNDDGEAAPTLPEFSNLVFEDVEIVGETLEYHADALRKNTAINIAGFDDNHKISNVRFKNVTIDNGHSSDRQIIGLQMVKNLTIENLNVK